MDRQHGVEMTPEDRAEKIRGILEYKTERMVSDTDKEIFADEIRNAETDKEMYFIGVLLPPQLVAGYVRGRDEAYEDAAKLIEARKGIPEHHSDIAALLRARAKEIK